eukprot:3058272-Rhodomonas_salina.2
MLSYSRGATGSAAARWHARRFCQHRFRYAQEHRHVSVPAWYRIRVGGYHALQASARDLGAPDAMSVPGIA